MDNVVADAERWFENALRRGRRFPDGVTTLMKIVMSTSEPRDVYAVLDGAPEIAGTINQQDSTGMTAMMYAAKLGRGDVLLEFLNGTANPNLKNADGKTALDLWNEALAEDEETREWFAKKVEAYIKKYKSSEKAQARDLAAAEQTLLRTRGEGLAAPGTAVSKAMDTGILQSQVGKFLTSKEIRCDTVKPAIR